MRDEKKSSLRESKKNKNGFPKFKSCSEFFPEHGHLAEKNTFCLLRVFVKNWTLNLRAAIVNLLLVTTFSLIDQLSCAPIDHNSKEINKNRILKQKIFKTCFAHLEFFLRKPQNAKFVEIWIYWRTIYRKFAWSHLEILFCFWMVLLGFIFLPTYLLPLKLFFCDVIL